MRSVRINRLKMIQAMAERYMTGKEICKMTGLNECTVSQIKNGRSCSQETADKLAAVLGPDIIEKEE